MIEFVKITLLGVLSAIVYGICHDQVTARVCVEYFTVAHPPVFDTDSPTLLAFGWGVIATWWVGAALGVLAALASRVGSWPRMSARQLIRPMLVLLIGIAVGSLVFGVLGYALARQGVVVLVEPLASRIAASKHVALIADGWAHFAAYAGGAVGGLVLCNWIIWRRRSQNTTTPIGVNAA